MIEREPKQLLADLDRRSFLRNSSFATVAALMGGIPLRAPEPSPDPSQAPNPDSAQAATAPPFKVAVIGCGTWARDILRTLAIIPKASVIAVCDTYAPMMKRAQRSAPDAEAVPDYKQVLESKEVEGVVVATPTHLHRDIVLEALRAGKHVYCEAPLAGSIDDARILAKAAQAAFKLNFQAGLQHRADPQRYFLLNFIRSGALGKWVMIRAQRHKKESWRRVAPTSEREQELNWRLRKETSLGLVGEIGIHHLDMASLFLSARPASVAGFGSIRFYDDGREMPDTVQTVAEYPNQVLSTFSCTLANSFEADHEVYYGSDSAVLWRDNRAWMFKEADAPLLSWEMNARRESFYKESGIVLGADATKLKKEPRPADGFPQPEEEPLYKSLQAFVTNSGILNAAVEDFVTNFGEDEPSLRQYLADVMKNRLPSAGAAEGLEATVTGIKANEAIMTGQKILFKPEWSEIG